MGHRTMDKLDLMFKPSVLFLQMSLLLFALLLRLLILESYMYSYLCDQGCSSGGLFLESLSTTLYLACFPSARLQHFGCLKQLHSFQGSHVFFGRRFFSGQGFIIPFFGPARKADLFGTSTQIPRMPPLGH